MKSINFRFRPDIRIILSFLLLVGFMPGYTKQSLPSIDNGLNMGTPLNNPNHPGGILPTGFITKDAGNSYQSFGFQANITVYKGKLSLQSEGMPMDGTGSYYSLWQGWKAVSNPENIELQFIDANSTSVIVPYSQQKSEINQFMGNNPSHWHSRLPIFSGLEMREIYPGVTLRIEEANSNLKNTYILAPGADPSQIQWKYPGAGSIRINESTHDCEVIGKNGQVLLVEQAPKAWQVRLGKSVPVASSFRVLSDGSLGFYLGDYNESIPLIIDPSILFSTYLGGTINDHAYDVVTDTIGNVFVTGYTDSSNFPIVGFPPPTPNPGAAFITKFSPSGEIVFSTIFGGTSGNEAISIDIDQQGNIIVGGATGSSDFPLADPIQPAFGGNKDAFIAKFDPSGSTLLFSTYHGGTGYDYLEGQTLKADGTLIAVGTNNGGDFPVTSGAIFPTPLSTYDGIVFAIDTNQKEIVFSTYFGGSANDFIRGVVVNSNDEPIIFGQTSSLNIPMQDPFQASHTGTQCFYGTCFETFITRLSVDGSSILYSSYLGGSNSEYIGSIALDPDENMIVFGATDSLDFPIKNAIQPVNMQGGYFGDLFITKLNKAGSELVFSTFLGGIFQEAGRRVAVGPTGEIYLTGTSDAACIPALSPLYRETQDALVIVLEPDGQGILYSQYLGGSSSENGFSLAIYPDKSVWVVGSTESSDFPLVNPFDASHNGQLDAFITHVADHPSAGEYTLYFPYASKSGPEGIHGYLTKWECGSGNRKLELRYYNGSIWSTRAMAYTTDDGFFNFADVPSLKPGEKYYVRFINESGSDESMAYYATRVLTEYVQGTSLEIDRFWIDNFGPGYPGNGETQPIPVTFGWSTNPHHPSDSYEFILYDDHDQNIYFSSGLLGYTSEYILTSLPQDFKAGKVYTWYTSVNTLNGGYGESFYAYSIRFTNSMLSNPYLPENVSSITRNFEDAANQFEAKNR